LGEKDVEVEGHDEGIGADIEARRIDMASVGIHQDHSAGSLRIEDRAAVKPPDGRRANEARAHVGAVGIRFILAQNAETIPKLDQVIGTRIGDRKPSAGPYHPRHFGEARWREHADDEVNGRVMHRPLAPRIGYREGGRRPAPRSLPRRILRDAEAQADDGAGQPRRYSSEVMTCPRTSHQNMLNTLRRSLDSPDDRRRERVEVYCLEELRTVPELRRAISRAAAPTE
jgi:hypothetical protein